MSLSRLHRSSSPKLFAILLSVSFAAAACMDEGTDAELDYTEDGGSPAAVLAWNQLLQDIAFAEDQFLTFKGVRCLAMMHIAQHDALNAVDEEFEQYVYFGHNGRANQAAALAQAGHDVAANQYKTGRASCRERAAIAIDTD